MATTSRGATPAIEPDFLAPLSLSSKPVVVPPPGPSNNPIFGVPSFAQSPPLDYGHSNDPFNDSIMDMEDDDEAPSPRKGDPDAMDWTPTNPSPEKPNHMLNGNGQARYHDDGSWLRPQRFFAPEEPTGLEGLFSTTIKLSDDEHATADAHARARGKFVQWLNPVKLWRR